MSDGQVWTGQLLAQRSGLSLRTVRRAVAALREAGVAIDTEVGRGGGLRLSTRSALPSVRLSHREAIGMLFALAVALCWTAREPAAQRYLDRVEQGTEILHYEQQAE